MAPMYGAVRKDPDLIALLHRLRPQHVIRHYWGRNPGTARSLPFKEHLDYLPADHCIGVCHRLP